MKIRVTQEDIDRGERRVHARCPIARSVQRDTGDPNAWVGSFYAVIPSRRSGVVCSSMFELPYEARRFVANFDAGNVPSEPFEFEL